MHNSREGVLFGEGRSFANLVSLSIVKKLNLHASAYPHSYNVQWLNQDKQLQVNYICLISFSIINKYQDELWCDVIPMDTCHILPGRSSMCDANVMHGG